MAKKLVCGIGFNDAGYTVNQRVNGKRVMCPFYQVWASMLSRCYSDKVQAKHPAYIDCSVVSRWLIFSNFKKWMETQDWKGKELDKDLLVMGSKIYSPDTCVFVDVLTNLFTTDRNSARGEWPLGVDVQKPTGRFRARCRNPFTGKHEALGCFNCPNQAHQAWKKRKHELALQLAELQTDQRVAKALRTRYI